MAKKKSWNEKLKASKAHQVKLLDKNIAGMKAGQMMLLPSPQLVDAFIRTIPEGESMTVVELRQTLAKQHHADVTCPIATGFVVKTVAEAAYENHIAGESLDEMTPIWRVLDENSPTLKKLSFDAAFILDQREVEGIA